MIDHNNLEEFADPHTYDIEDNTDASREMIETTLAFVKTHN